MKNYILSLLSAVIILFSACKKSNNDKPDDISDSGAYQPFTPGSTWNYHNDYLIADKPGDPVADTTVNTMTAGTKLLNNKTFHQLISVTGRETEEDYLCIKDHLYYNYTVDTDNNTLELPYLSEETSLNSNWIAPITFMGSGATQIKGTITEKNVAKTIRGKTYQDVIHSKLELQALNNKVYTTILTFDFYVAKNIGIIAIYTAQDGTVLSKSELISYSIK